MPVYGRYTGLLRTRRLQTRKPPDSFECAIHALAPVCEHCGMRIVGHGLEDKGKFYCCDHCAEQKRVKGLRDRKH
jgi:hypothetical protein